MKKILLFALGITTLLSSCDVLEGPFDEKVTIDTTAGPKRKILLEDFTGHTCGNCPCAAYEAIRLDTTYKGRIIVVASHVGFFAEPYTNGTKFRTDFRTPAGTEVNDYFQIDAQGLPQGNSKYLKEGNSNHQLVVYVVEDSIINWQKFYSSCGGVDKEISDYVHRHVLRGAVNSTWGDALYTAGSIIPIGTSVNKSYTQVLDPIWEAKHIYFVAFIQDNVTKEVVQVEEVKLIE